MYQTWGNSNSNIKDYRFQGNSNRQYTDFGSNNNSRNYTDFLR